MQLDDGFIALLSAPFGTANISIREVFASKSAICINYLLSPFRSSLILRCAA